MTTINASPVRRAVKVEKRRVVAFVNVVPDSTGPRRRTRPAVPPMESEPSAPKRIERRACRSCSAARIGVLSIFSAHAVGSRFVVDAQPTERHGPNDFADSALKFELPPRWYPRGRAPSPMSGICARRGQSIRADDQHGRSSPVDCRAAAQNWPRASKGGPQSSACFRRFLRMSPTRTRAAPRPCGAVLTGFAEEVDAAAAAISCGRGSAARARTPPIAFLELVQNR